MERKFRYKFDRRVRRATWIICVLIVLLFAAFYIFAGEVTYLPAWIISIVAMLWVLYLLSIPRFLLVDDDAFEIHCIVELTRIHVEDIDEARVMPAEEIRGSFPLLGSYAFGGYYGYYFNPNDFNVFKMYASQWDNFVIVRDIYEDTYVVSCAEPEELVRLILEARDRRRREIRLQLESREG